MLTILKIENYAKWKSDWDSSIEMRKAVGQKSHQILCPVDDPNKVVLLIEWDSLDHARKFGESEELREALKRSGASLLESYLLEELEKGSL